VVPCARKVRRPLETDSGDQFISRGEDKRTIVRRFNAQACEMEGGAIAQTCYLSGTPCAILRVISDSTDNDHFMEYSQFLPLAVEKSYNILMQALQ
jgi:adenosylhomocysteine nucleosidase